MSLRAGTQRDISFQEYAANAAMMSATPWHEECGAQSVERSNAAANAAMMSAVEWHEECEAQSVERSNAAANAAMMSAAEWHEECEAIPQNVPHESRQRMEE